MIPLPTVDLNPSPLSPGELRRLGDEIRGLARERDAVILAHNYQIPEIQSLADYVGDSLGLSLEAKRAGAQTIVFCGVHFMAETAAILCPQAQVLIPDKRAGCSLADSITAEQLRAWKAKHPGAAVVMYVNTSAAVKAETDWCCTSSNAVAVVERIFAELGEDQEVLFGPDLWLGSFVSRRTGRHLEIWDGECHVHAGIRPSDLNDQRAAHPRAELLIHPECGCSTQAMEFVASGDVDEQDVSMLSTGQMLSHVRERPRGEYIVATETGMIHGLEQAAPKAKFIAANRAAVCKYMKMITVPKLAACLRDPADYEVTVDQATADQARLAIERMISVS